MFNFEFSRPKPLICSKHGQTPTFSPIKKRRRKKFSKSSNSNFSSVGEPRSAVLHKGKKGFGFVLRGAKAASPLMEMIPSDKCPGLQYMDDVDPAGVADMAGIRKGDFLLEVKAYKNGKRSFRTQAISL